MCRGESAAFILCGLAAGNACIVLRRRRAYAAGTKGLRPLDSQDAPHPLSAFGAFPFMGGFYPLNNCEGKFYQ